MGLHPRRRQPDPDVIRRRLVQGLALGAAVGTLPPSHAAPRSHQARPQRVLTGTEFDLRIGSTWVNYTGASRLATTVNGSLPAPVLRWREGSTVTLRVTNTLPVTTSIHWHGILLPFEMDGVPGISFRGIEPGETFVYRFPVKQSGTYWYHSHSAFQEQQGLYGPILIDPQGGDPLAADRDHVMLLSDWTDEDPMRLFTKLKVMPDYYNYQKPTVGDFLKDIREVGLGTAVQRRRMWNQMRMNPTDLVDVSSATYTYLVNGSTPSANWLALAHAGERVRLRFINGSADSIFDVRIPGLEMTVVAADGQPVHPVAVDEFRISTAETYDVIVTLPEERAYTIFAQSIDRTGFARATLATREGLEASVPPLDPKSWVDMVDMGMGDMAGMKGMDAPDGSDTEPMAAMDHGGGSQPMSGMAGMDRAGMGMPSASNAAPDPMAGRDHGGGTQPMPGMSGGGAGMKGGTGPAVDMRAMSPSSSRSDPGPRLRGNGRRVLTYADLRTVGGPIDRRSPGRDIELHLTGNMQRFIWGFDGKKYSEAEPIRLKLGERVRIVLVNDTMMTHPIHLHGMWSEIEDERGGFLVRKHTVNVHPGHRISYQVTADAPGQWAFHCHLLYHMEAGMFRKVVVA